MKRTLLLLAVLLAGTASTTLAQHYLRIADPQRQFGARQGTIEEATVSLKPHGAYIEVGLYMTLGVRDSPAPASTQLEAEFDFALPEGSLMTDSWLWVGDDIMQAQIMDVWTARDIYEGIVNRRRDPSILYYKGNNRYELRVYPVFPTETRKVKINYLVPAELVGGSATAPLPIQMMQQASRHPLTSLSILAWGEAWGVPKVSGVANPPEFQYQTPDDVQPHFKTTLDLTAGGTAAGVEIPIPFKEGIHFSSFEEGGNKYFQLLLNPEHFIPGGDARHVLVLLDHESSNTTISPEGAVAAVSAALKAQLRSTDYFNVIVSKLDVTRYSDSWTPATPQAIDAAFATVGAPATYSSLPGLLSAGLSHARQTPEPESIVLVSSSSGFNSAQKAEGLLRDLGVGDLAPFLQVVDYQDRGWSSYRIQGRTYTGNEYFYERMAGPGDVHRVATASTLQSTIGVALGLTGTRISTMDLYTDASQGFTFDRHLSVDPLSMLPASEGVSQIGRYVGEPPFEVRFSGIVGSAPFSVEASVPAEDIHTGNVNIGRAWAGFRLHELEDRSQTNDVINEVLALSLRHRVLSQYTAFLALEPSDSTFACSECVDETTITGTEAFELPSADSLLQVYPNPVRDQATIRIALPEQLASGGASLKIFDILGREVRTFAIRPGGGTESIGWDRRSDSGDRLAAGVYVVALQVGGQMRTTRVVLM